MTNTTTVPIQATSQWSRRDCAYEKAGDPRFWVDARSVRRWYHRQAKRRRGRPMVYSTDAIRVVLAVQLAYRLPLRAAIGLVKSTFAMLGIDLPVPSRTTLARRRMTDTIILPRLRRGEALVLLMDSTGLKVMGASEWRRRYGPRGETWVRDFRKSHIAVDEATGLILATELTSSRVHDHQLVDTLLADTGPPVTLVADGAYDRATVWALAEEGVEVRVPPRVDAAYWKDDQPGGIARNEAMVMCYNEESRAQWKQDVGYHVRSKVETVMSRSKMMLGDRLHARNDAGRQYENTLRALVLNQMLLLQLPEPGS